MSRHFKETLEELKKFFNMTPLLEDITFSKYKNVFLAVYDYGWGAGKAYARWDISNKKSNIRFSIDYGIRCEKAYIMQVSTFLTHLNEKNEEVKMVLHSDGTVISEGFLSFGNAPLKRDDFDKLFSSSFFFERFIDDIRKLSVGGFVYSREIIESKLEEDHSILLTDFDDDDELEDIETPSLFGASITPRKPPESPDIDSLLQKIDKQQELLRFQNDNIPNENSELVRLINSSNKKDDDGKEDT